MFHKVESYSGQQKTFLITQKLSLHEQEKSTIWDLKIDST